MPRTRKLPSRQSSPVKIDAPLYTKEVKKLEFIKELFSKKPGAPKPTPEKPTDAPPTEPPKAPDPLQELLTQHQQELSLLQRQSALEIALLKAGARDPKTVLPLLNGEQITLEEGALSGLTEQVETLRQTAGYLFYSGGTVSGGEHRSPPGTTPDTLAEALGSFYHQ